MNKQKTTINKYNVKVGDVFALEKRSYVCCYHYFFQIIRVTPTNVEIAEIRKDSDKNSGYSCYWDVSPRIGDFSSCSQWYKGETTLKKVSLLEQNELAINFGKYRAYKIEPNRSFLEYDNYCD